MVVCVDKYISKKNYEKNTIENLKQNTLNVLTKRNSQLSSSKGSCQALKIAVLKVNLLLLLAEVCDNYTYIMKCEQAKITTDEPALVLSKIYFGSA